MKRTKLKKISDNRRELLAEKPEKNELHEFFMELWDSREDERGIINCFESGRELKREAYRSLSTCYSHILPKEMYPQYKYREENIKIVFPGEHFQYSLYPEKTPKQFAEYQKLLKLHEKGEL
jgi:hypothetical protein